MFEARGALPFETLPIRNIPAESLQNSAAHIHRDLMPLTGEIPVFAIDPALIRSFRKRTGVVSRRLKSNVLHRLLDCTTSLQISLDAWDNSGVSDVDPFEISQPPELFARTDVDLGAPLHEGILTTTLDSALNWARKHGC